jgi:hypothetical protein
MAKTPHWTYRRTEERETLMQELRELLDRLSPEGGVRIHGVLTDAQIFDWALQELHAASIDKRTERDSQPE